MKRNNARRKQPARKSAAKKSAAKKSQARQSQARKSQARQSQARQSQARKNPAKNIQATPSGYHNVTPYLSVAGAAEAIDFYKKALGAKEIMRMPGPDGKLGHVEIQIGDSRVMLADEYEDSFAGPKSLGGTTVHLHVYVKDADAQFEKALAAGGTVIEPLEDKFYGDRSGCIEDPFGHRWHLSTHTRDVPMAEMQRKAAAMAKGEAPGQQAVS